MSFLIQKGLFNTDFTDYHAILGVPVDAQEQEIRKRYTRIAKKLHPDSSAIKNETEKKLAEAWLSKVVNPAKEKLYQEKERAEHAVMLRLKGQQAIKQPGMIEEVQSDVAKQLVQASDIEGTYKTALKQLAGQQYESLDRMQNVTEEISELNLVYLMRIQSNGAIAKPQQPAAAPAKSQAPAGTKGKQQPEPEKPPKKSPVDDYYRRAEELVERANTANAILELRDALKLEPNNGKCHSLLGEIYFQQNQTTMAKIHLKKALDVNPKDEKALQVKEKLEKMMRKKAAAGKSSGKSGKKSDGDGGITIFGIKFGGGGKKKK